MGRRLWPQGIPREALEEEELPGCALLSCDSEEDSEEGKAVVPGGLGRGRGWQQPLHWVLTGCQLGLLHLNSEQAPLLAAAAPEKCLLPGKYLTLCTPTAPATSSLTGLWSHSVKPHLCADLPLHSESPTPGPQLLGRVVTLDV